jgi:hypothetical protein
MTEYANGMVMLEGDVDDRGNPYEQAAACSAYAVERLNIDMG